MKRARPKPERAPAAASKRPAAPPEPYSPAARLRTLITAAREEKRCLAMPACHDALSAALVERAGFELCFMSGYAVSATQLALPDAGLISYGEQLQVGRSACEAARRLCIIGDGDTGFGASSNVRRTIAQRLQQREAMTTAAAKRGAKRRADDM